jgi:pyruvate formate lyase activating enzyme
LLVPGYVDDHEVRRIARLVAGQNAEILYALLGFAPGFCMQDLPHVSLGQAEVAREAALASGLTNVRIGNRHLLSSDARPPYEARFLKH